MCEDKNDSVNNTATHTHTFKKRKRDKKNSEGPMWNLRHFPDCRNPHPGRQKEVRHNSTTNEGGRTKNKLTWIIVSSALCFFRLKENLHWSGRGQHNQMKHCWRKEKTDAREACLDVREPVTEYPLSGKECQVCESKEAQLSSGVCEATKHE